MSPQRTGALAYYAAGGSVISRSGAKVSASAAALLAFYQQEATARRLIGDEAGSIFCGRMALELAIAIARTDDWRRATAGVGRQAAAED